MGSKKLKIDNNNSEENINKIFSDFLDNKIIEKLINYLLINNNSNNEYSIKQFYNHINEILNYSTVSKTWYDLISNLISNNIKNNNLIEYWFNSSKINNNNNEESIIKMCINDKSISFLYNFNKEFSIIKIDEYIINDYFNNQVLITNDNQTIFKYCINENDNGTSIENDQDQLIKSKLSKFRKIILNIKNDDDSNLIKSLFENSNLLSNKIELNVSNIKFDENYLKNHLISIENHGNYENDENGNEIKKKDNLKKQINKLHINGSNDELLFKSLINFQPKEIVYDPIGNNNRHINYSNLFSKESIGDKIESIKILKSDHIEPIHLLNINQFSNLHTLSIPLQINDIIKSTIYEQSENGCDYNNGLKHKITPSSNSSIGEWNQMIDSLINLKSLKILKLNNIIPITTATTTTTTSITNNSSSNCSEIKNLNYSDTTKEISNGIQKLLLNETNNGIEYLKLYNFNFQLLNNNDFIKRINNNNSNSSIKTLVLKNDDSTCNYLENDIIYLISNILTLNNFNSIKHLKLKLLSNQLILIPIIIEQLTKNLYDLNLYSITLNIDQSQFEDILEFIRIIISTSSTLSNTISLKEFNLSINKKEKQQKKEELNEKLNEFYKNNTNKNHSIIINIL